mmetsp:Transcript_33627/g.106927  ORF Transcript_33627/g.106927 Transcript_33627/m.106927 type:complete len:453 (+) Transcript_33627:164-1522(+)
MFSAGTYRAAAAAAGALLFPPACAPLVPLLARGGRRGPFYACGGGARSWGGHAGAAETCDVAVVGGGIMGSATAFHLAQKGLSVMLLEQYDFLHSRGSSHGDSRITRKSYPQAYYTSMMKEAYSLWNEAEEMTGLKIFTPTGGIDFGEDGSPGITNVVASSEINGEPYEVLSPAELQARFPMWALPEGYSAVYSPQSGVLDATRGVAVHQFLARAHEVDLRDNVTVTGIRLGPGGADIETSEGRVSAGKVVVTAGPWAGRMLGESIRSGASEAPLAAPPLRPIHTTVAYYKCNPDMLPQFKGRCPIFLFRNEHRGDAIYGMPVPGRKGVIKVGRHGGPDTDPDNRSTDPHEPDLRDFVVPFIERYMTGINVGQRVEAHGCMYTMTPDEDFILDHLPGSGGVCTVGAGFSGHGFKLGPLVGRILADLAVGDNPYPGQDIMKHFRFDRFAGRTP